jgi:energy-coupling factor transporter transmembrane protein EcfT
LFAYGGLVALLLFLAQARAGEVFRVVKSYSGFLIFFFAVGIAFEPTWEQAQFLGIQGVRLALLLLLGHVLYLAATPSDVVDGIRWTLGFLGRRRAWMAASMAAWALASVPQVLDQAAQLGDAVRLRGQSPRHPVRGMTLMTLGLLVRTIERTTDLAAALEARGFGQSVPELTLRARWRDFVFLGAMAAACATAWAFAV